MGFCAPIVPRLRALLENADRGATTAEFTGDWQSSAKHTGLVNHGEERGIRFFACITPERELNCL